MYPIPVNERHRQDKLDAYDILDTPEEAGFDTLTRLAKRQFNVPIALVSFVDRDRQWFKSHAGLDASETHRELAFCAHSILSDETMVVADASADPRFSDNQLVTGDPRIRFYAGAPLVTPDGFRLGTFCVIDTVPRPFFSAAEIDALEGFAALVMEILELRRAGKNGSATDAEDPAAAAKMDAFALVAHEIRSPITTIIGLARVMDQRPFGPLSESGYAEYLSDLSGTAEHLGAVTDRMLDYARLGTGDIEIRDGMLNAKAVLQQARQAILPVAAENRNDIEVTGVPDDLNFRADPTLMQQMIGNLLANALKFSPEGAKIELSARLNAVNEPVIEIRDRGPGISDEDLAALDSPEKARHVPRPTESGGTGLGLSLVRLLVEAHGGRLRITRRKNGGTRAILRLPGYRLDPLAAAV